MKHRWKLTFSSRKGKSLEEITNLDAASSGKPLYDEDVVSERAGKS